MNTTPALPPLAQLTGLFTDGSGDQVVALFRKIRDEHGDEWLAAIQAEFPSACWIADLVANYTADEALDIICKEYPLPMIRTLAGNQIKTLHEKLRYEIEVKR